MAQVAPKGVAEVYAQASHVVRRLLYPPISKTQQVRNCALPSGHSVQQSAVPVRSGRRQYPSRISLPTSLKSCVLTWNNIKQEGCFPIPRTSSHIKIVGPTVALKVLGAVRRSACPHTCATLTRNIPTVYDHRVPIGHTAVVGPRTQQLHGLSRTSSWFGGKRYAGPCTRCVSPTTSSWCFEDHCH